MLLLFFRVSIDIIFYGAAEPGLNPCNGRLINFPDYDDDDECREEVCN